MIGLWCQHALPVLSKVLFVLQSHTNCISDGSNHHNFTKSSAGHSTGLCPHCVRLSPAGPGLETI